MNNCCDLNRDDIALIAARRLRRGIQIDIVEPIRLDANFTGVRGGNRGMLKHVESEYQLH